MVTPETRSRFGLSIVMKFASAASAKAELASDIDLDGPWRLFKVPRASPGRAWLREALAPGAVWGTSGRNVASPTARTFYLVGAG